MKKLYLLILLWIFFPFNVFADNTFLSLKKDKVLPIYKLISNTGPRHNPIFKVAVKLKNTRFIEGSGSSKKNAEQSAAEQLFRMYKDELAR